MKAKSSKLVKPSPYIEVGFNCGYRAFYNILNKVTETFYELGHEEKSDFFHTSCDYEGDLEKIYIYNHADENKSFILKLCDIFEIKMEEKIEDYELVLTC